MQLMTASTIRRNNSDVVARNPRLPIDYFHSTQDYHAIILLCNCVPLYVFKVVLVSSFLCCMFLNTQRVVSSSDSWAVADRLCLYSVWKDNVYRIATPAAVMTAGATGTAIITAATAVTVIATVTTHCTVSCCYRIVR